MTTSNKIDQPTLMLRPWIKPPLSLAILRYTGRDDIICVELPTASDPILKINSEVELHGDHTIARYLCRARPRSMLYAEDEEDAGFKAAEIDQYLAVCENYAGATLSSMQDLFVHLENRMISRTFLVGHRLSIADIAVWLLLVGVPMNYDEFTNLNRWISHIESNTSLLALRQQIKGNASH